jgi:hypothetical protein
VADRSSFSRSLGYVVAGAALVRLVLLIVSAIDQTFLVTYRLPDDAMYYFSIAENLKHAFGMPLLTYDGIHATNGMHPLWVFLLGPIFLLGLGKWTAVLVALGFQSAIDCVTVWLIGTTTYYALDDCTAENRRSISLVVAALYAFNAAIVVRGINGLETTIAALLLVLWIRCAIAVVRDSGAGWFGVVTGLVLLARTDTAILIAPACLWMLAHATMRPRVLRALAIAAVMLVPWLVWNYANFGSIMQSSGLAVPYFAMKKYDALYTSVGTIRHLSADAFRNVLKPWLLAGLLVPIAAVFVAWRRERREPIVQLIVLVSIGSVLLLLIHTYLRGFIREWYVLMQVPLILVLFGVAAGRLSRPFGLRANSRARFAVAIILLLLPFGLKVSYLSQRIVVERGVPMIERLTASSKVAALNSGYYGYFAGRPGSVVNIDGVVNYDAYRAIRAGQLERYILSDSVDYVMDFAGDLGGYQGLIDKKFLTQYDFDTVLVTKGATEELVLYRRKTGVGRGN